MIQKKLVIASVSHFYLASDGQCLLSLRLLGVRYRVLDPVSLTLKNETGLGIGIVH